MSKEEQKVVSGGGFGGGAWFVEQWWWEPWMAVVGLTEAPSLAGENKNLQGRFHMVSMAGGEGNQ
jgi:hypothetical protein